ncbi:MAG: DUF3459 domain-containing protein, partial [Pseudomonadota bacterium]
AVAALVGGLEVAHFIFMRFRDGLRLDATEWLIDRSSVHLMQELATAARAAVPAGRKVLIVAESHENEVRYLQPADEGGHGFDAVWVDDFYWSLRRFGTGETAGRLQDYSGALDAVARTLNQGFHYEGDHSAFCGGPRGSRARDVPAWHFHYALQHHDHVGNRAMGDRLHHATGLDWYRVASAVLLLQPATPLLFMGQEFASSSPFRFFTDHNEQLGRAVARGRRREFMSDPQFDRSLRLPNPQAVASFDSSVLPLEERSRSPGREIEALYRSLISLRSRDSVLRAQKRRGFRAAALHDELLMLHWDQAEGARMLLANFGPSRRVAFAAAGVTAVQWTPVLATNATQFGGDGEFCDVDETGVCVPGHTAVFLEAGPDSA